MLISADGIAYCSPPGPAVGQVLHNLSDLSSIIVEVAEFRTEHDLSEILAAITRPILYIVDDFGPVS